MVSNGEYLRFSLNFENGCCSKLQMRANQFKCPCGKNGPGQIYGVWEDPHGAASCNAMKGINHQVQRHEPRQTQHTGRAAELQNREGRLEAAAAAAPAQPRLPRATLPLRRPMFPKSIAHQKADNGLKYSSAVWFTVTVVRRCTLVNSGGRRGKGMREYAGEADGIY